MQYGERTRRSPIRAVRAAHAPGVTNEFPAGLDDLQRKITCLELEHTASATILDRFQVGVFVADTDGFVLQVNRTARAIAAGCDEIPTVTDASMRFESIWFHRLVDPLINRDDTARDHRIVSCIPRSSGKRPLQVLVEPVRASGLRPVGDPAVIIFVSDPEGHIETNEHTLRRLYGFTKTEARVAGLLVEGVATQDIATRLGISSGTTRWHVKHLLLKTSTVSQRQLVCLLITGVASVRFD